MRPFRAIRERMKLTQVQLAAELGCTQGNVSFYERGQKVPPDVAGRLIAVASKHGHTVTFDDVYADHRVTVES